MSITWPHSSSSAPSPATSLRYCVCVTKLCEAQTIWQLFSQSDSARISLQPSAEFTKTIIRGLSFLSFSRLIFFRPRLLWFLAAGLADFQAAPTRRCLRSPWFWLEISLTIYSSLVWWRSRISLPLLSFFGLRRQVMGPETVVIGLSMPAQGVLARKSVRVFCSLGLSSRHSRPMRTSFAFSSWFLVFSNCETRFAQTSFSLTFLPSSLVSDSSDCSRNPWFLSCLPSMLSSISSRASQCMEQRSFTSMYCGIFLRTSPSFPTSMSSPCCLWNLAAAWFCVNSSKSAGMPLRAVLICAFLYFSSTSSFQLSAKVFFSLPQSVMRWLATFLRSQSSGRQWKSLTRGLTASQQRSRMRKVVMGAELLQFWMPYFSQVLNTFSNRSFRPRATFSVKLERCVFWQQISTMQKVLKVVTMVESSSTVASSTPPLPSTDCSKALSSQLHSRTSLWLCRLKLKLISFSVFTLRAKPAFCVMRSITCGGILESASTWTDWYCGCPYSGQSQSMSSQESGWMRQTASNLGIFLRLSSSLSTMVMPQLMSSIILMVLLSTLSPQLSTTRMKVSVLLTARTESNATFSRSLHSSRRLPIKDYTSVGTQSGGEEVHVAVLSAVETALLVLLVDVGEHQPLRVPLQRLLVLAALDAVGLPAPLAVEHVDRVGVAAGREVVALGVHAHPPEGGVAAARVHPLADQVRQRHQLRQRVLPHRHELLPVPRERNVGDARAVTHVGVAQQFVGVGVVEGNGPHGALAPHHEEHRVGGVPHSRRHLCGTVGLGEDGGEGVAQRAVVVDHHSVVAVEDCQSAHFAVGVALVPAEPHEVVLAPLLDLELPERGVLADVPEAETVAAEGADQVGTAELGVVDAAVVPLDLAALLEGVLGEVPALDDGFGGEQEGAGGVPGQRRRALLVRRVVLLLVGAEQLHVRNVEAFLAQPAHTLLRQQLWEIGQIGRLGRGGWGQIGN